MGHIGVSALKSDNKTFRYTRRHPIAKRLLLCTFLLLPISTNAQILRVEYVGHVTSVTGDGFGKQVGEKFLGEFYVNNHFMSVDGVDRNGCSDFGGIGDYCPYESNNPKVNRPGYSGDSIS